MTRGFKSEADPQKPIRDSISTALGRPTPDHLPQVVDQWGQIAEACHRSDPTFKLESEANSASQNGHTPAEIHGQVNHPAMVLIFDAAHVLCQSYSVAEVFEQYRAIRTGLGSLRIKDSQSPKSVAKDGHIDEQVLTYIMRSASTTRNCGKNRPGRKMASLLGKARSDP